MADSGGTHGTSDHSQKTTVALRGDAATVDLLAEAGKLWGQRRRGEIDWDTHEVLLFALERKYGVDITPCARCDQRRAYFYDPATNVWLCRRCKGDDIDLGWEAYRDATS